MTTIRSLIALFFVASLAIACGSQAESSDADTSAPESAAGATDNAPETTTKPSSDSTDSCGHLDPADLRTALGLDAATEIAEADALNAHRYNDRSRSCNWTWDGGRVSLQITTEPENNQFDTWASRMVARHLEDGKGGSAVETVGDSAVFVAKESLLVWRQGEGTLFNLSFAGNAPGQTLDLDTLKALAQAIEE